MQCDSQMAYAIKKNYLFACKKVNQWKVKNSRTIGTSVKNFLTWGYSEDCIRKINRSEIEVLG